MCRAQRKCTEWCHCWGCENKVDAGVEVGTEGDSGESDTDSSSDDSEDSDVDV